MHRDAVPTRETEAAPLLARPRRALVLGDYRQTLSVVRSLHHAGFTVLVGTTGKRPVVGWSRHVEDSWLHPPFDANPEGFAAALATLAASAAEPLLIFPVGELEIAHFARHASIPNTVLAMPAADHVAVCMNKASFYRTAQSLGLTVAHFELAERADVDAAIARIGTPCVLKPVSSLDDTDDVKAVVLNAAPSQPMATQLSGWPQVLVQRWVDGVRHNVHFVAHEGDLLAYFEQSVLRTTRLDGAGYGVDGMSVEPSAERRRICERLIGALRYSGPGCLQFLVDEKAQRNWVLELNPRLDATVAVALHCGVDLPRLAVDEALCRHGIGAEPRPPARPYRIGVRAAWTTGDLRALAHACCDQHVGWRTALRWTTQLTVSLLAADLHLTFDWSDPLPSLLGLAAAMIVAPMHRFARALRRDKHA